jgi:hypothetical protein
MRTIETQADLTAEGWLTARVATDLPPGKHQVVIVIDESTPSTQPRQPLTFSAHPVGLLSDDFTFRREDIYDDDL